MKKSILALTVAMAAASGAHAAWDYGSGADPAYGNGEALLAVWDSNANNKVSVAQDLGTHFKTFASNLTNTSFSESYTLDPSAFSVFKNADGSIKDPRDMQWGIVVLSNGAFNTPMQDVMATTNTTDTNAMAMKTTNVGNVINASIQTASLINGTDTNYAANNAVVGTPAQGNYAGGPRVFGPSFTADSFPFTITAGINNSLSFWEFNSPDTTGIANVKAVGQWSIDLSKGTLTYAAPVSSVPVPGAAWLMGSALIGLGSIARRRRAA